MALIVVFGAAGLAPAASAAASDAAPVSDVAPAGWAPDHILVSFDPTVPAAERQRLVAAVAAGPLQPIGLHSSLLPVAAGGSAGAFERLRALAPRVVAEPDVKLTEAQLPDDYYYGGQWALANTGQYDYEREKFGAPGADIDAELAWSTTTGSDQVVVGVIDGGITLSHPDLVDNLWSNPGGIGGCPAGTHGYNAVGNDCTPADVGAHGTHVAGIIAARGNNGQGIAGVAWNAKLMGLRTLDSAGSSTVSNLIEVIHWAVEAKRAGVNLRVLNASLSGNLYSQALHDEIVWAGANDILFVTAAGNGGDDGEGDDLDIAPGYPCDFPIETIVCVANSTSSDDLHRSSNFGAGNVDLAAPGTDILSTTPLSYPPVNNGGYWRNTGTSMAAPFVAGAAALALSQGYLSAPALKARLLAGVDTLPTLTGLVATGGRLNLCKVVSGCTVPLVPSPNDNFAAAIDMFGRSGYAGSSGSATREAGEPAHGDASVWFSEYESGAGILSIDAATAFPARIVVYTGSSVGDLTLMAVSQLGTDLRLDVVVDLLPGTGSIYRIALLSAAGPGGSYSFRTTWTREGYEPLPKQAWLPDTVSGVSASAGEGSAVVSWDEPDGHRSAITTYTVRVYRNGLTVDDIEVPAPDRRLVLSGLSPGQTYGFRVAATNSVGTGYFSVMSPRVVPGGTVPPADPGHGPAGPPLLPGAAAFGYWMLGADGAVYPFGDARRFGNAPVGTAEAVDIEPTPSGNGYWVVDELGRVWPFGDAFNRGGVDRSRLAPGEKVTSISATVSGGGYWIFTSRGRVLIFGDAVFLGDVSHLGLNGPVLDSVITPSGAGYFMVASDGGIFAFGDARFVGSMGGRRLNAPAQSLVPDGDGHGYWLVASDGGVFAFAAGFKGSMGATTLNRPVTGMVRAGPGYLMVAEDGGIFDFSGTPNAFRGSLGANPPARPITAVAVLE